MRRKREQTGTIFRAHGMWYVRYFEDRVEGGVIKHARVAKQIGEVKTRGKRPPKEIEDEARDIVASAKLSNRTPDRVLTVGDFVDDVYFPFVEQQKRPSTVKGYRDIWNNHVSPFCKSAWLKDIRIRDVQGWLDSVAKPQKLGRNSLKHIKTFISAVFKHAMQQGYYFGANPVRDTAISPSAAEPADTYAYSLEEVQAILRFLPERAATVFSVAAFAGLRRSEIQGLQWENYSGGVLRVARAIWEGHVSDPKTKRSKGAVPVIRHLAERLDLYRIRCGNPTVGPMFPASNKKPVSLHNVLNREILPALERCAICGKQDDNHAKATHDFKRDESIPTWHGWHAARRGLGTNLYSLGVPEKVIQDILRHANVSTTATYYIKTVPQQLTDAMAKLENAMPSGLSVNEVSTSEWEQAASSAVN
jgi:integrase